MNNFKKYIFEMLEDEYWYGPIVNDGVKLRGIGYE